MSHTAVMPEGEKHWGGAVVIGGDNLPSLVRIGLTDLQNIGGASGSGTTDRQFSKFDNFLWVQPVWVC